MPLIEIQALPQRPGVEIPQIISQLSQALAEVLMIPPAAVRCTWQELQAQHYAEGGQLGGERQTDDSHPILVKVLMFEGRSQDLIEHAIQTIAEHLPQALGLKQKNLFISYYEAKSGQLFVGGKLKYKN